MKKETVSIEGMSCMHCVKAVENSAKGVAGVVEIIVDLKGKNAEVEFDENKTTLEIIVAAIEEEGYKVK